MPKKTVHARSGAQRSKTRQKGFELVRPVSDENVLEAAENTNETEAPVSEEEEMETVEAPKEAEVAEKVPVAATISTESTPKSSVASRLAARRQAALKAQRAPVNLISAENYGYVRKDLLFILILAVIMFSAIIIMHFVPAIGG